MHYDTLPDLRQNTHLTQWTMTLRFTKMHGLGNDYIFFDLVDKNCPCQTLTSVQHIDWATISRQLSNRHTGIGGDGIVLILPDETYDFRMRIFNADGSEAEMCGNAARCIGKYVYEHHLTDKTTIQLATLSNVKEMQLHVNRQVVESVTIDMGKPTALQTLPAHIIKEANNHSIIYVNIGNPHAVLLLDNENIQTGLVHTLGPVIEHASPFSHGTNVEFVHVKNRHEICMRVWERGSGETMACGTGACASVVAAHQMGLTDNICIVHLLGGDLTIQIQENGHILMSGGATEVFSGEITTTELAQ